MTRLRSHVLLLILLILCAGTAIAGQVLWSSERFARNVTSLGTELLSTSHVFELGGFESGFIPTAANASEWRNHWVPLAQAGYNAEFGFFAASTDVSAEMISPNLESQGYIWGWNQVEATSGAEWILLTNTTWQWPTSKNKILPPEEWTTNTATETILGSVNPSAGIHLQTAAPFPASSHAVTQAWLSKFDLGSPNDSRIWDIDTDGDGMTNLIEYAAGTNPLESASKPNTHIALVSYGDGRAVTLTFDKNPQARVDYTIEISTDLKQWASNDDNVVIVSDSAETLIVRDLHPATSQRRFLRLKVSLLP
jgi:hypothetical protein